MASFVPGASRTQSIAEDKDDSGGGCSAGPAQGAWPVGSLLALGWALRRRKGSRGTDA
ncbi:MYXO-CTERM sorting domain-containing protein [Corallococcus sp. BB11-1]|uniref:MYXO-CTERM sorting domain-containing protein n=1 Tax=Corallococcus sp. BB11-1 TaxID=2996783 RepID=UPI00226EAB37|nr:MYXO-CTERM sorting domain-containing protein [Corallococcus sp. BB11-1]MCY1032454.1 MYXO-CTERM sorting domain-containing protein [Corallococcus sp. BB11-1]